MRHVYMCRDSGSFYLPCCTVHDQKSCQHRGSYITHHSTLCYSLSYCCQFYLCKWNFMHKRLAEKKEVIHSTYLEILHGHNVSKLAKKSPVLLSSPDRQTSSTLSLSSDAKSFVKTLSTLLSVILYFTSHWEQPVWCQQRHRHRKPW